VLAEFELRVADHDRMALNRVLEDVYRRLLGAHPLPAHRTDWSDRMALAARQLGQSAMAEPHPAHALAARCGKVLFDHLPIHESLRVHDEEMILNQMRMGLMHHQETLRKRLDPEAVLADLQRPAG
jgi:hypothetical protein